LFQPRVDRALFGGPLQLPREANGRATPAWPYAKGLAIHSRTKIVYRLPREFRSFSAIAGIDSRVRPAGNVRLVSGDWNRAYLDEMEGFPHGKHDDQVDASSGAHAKLVGTPEFYLV